MSRPLMMFLIFVAITLGITWWASRQSCGASAYFAASRLATGLIASLALIVASPSIMGVDGRHLIHGAPLFPLENPGIISIPLGFVGAFIATMMSRVDENAEAKFTELEVRANIGHGAERAVAG